MASAEVPSRQTWSRDLPLEDSKEFVFGKALPGQVKQARVVEPGFVFGLLGILQILIQAAGFVANHHVCILPVHTLAAFTALLFHALRRSFATCVLR